MIKKNLICTVVSPRYLIRWSCSPFTTLGSNGSNQHAGAMSNDVSVDIEFLLYTRPVEKSWKLV